MRTIFRRLMAGSCAAILATGSADAQDEEIPDFGFLRLVNVVAAGEGNTSYYVDGGNLYPKGYRFGQRTGGVPLEPGTIDFQVRKEGVITGKTTFTVVKDETTTLIAFSEKVEVEDGEPPEWKARILKLKQRDAEKGFRLTVVSVCKQEEIAFLISSQGGKIGGKPSVKRFMTTTLDLGKTGGDVEIRQTDGKTRLCRMSPDSPGNYVVVLYNDAEGNIKAMNFYDPKFVVAG